jgi:4-nitrophenyl phosphatase
MIKAVLLDLDGTVYLGDRDIPGAAEFVAMLRARSIAHLFVTNRANRRPETIREQLLRHDIPCAVSDILTSAQATARHIGSGSVYYIGEAGMQAAFEEQGIEITEEKPDYVVVGFDRGFNYDKLKKACRLIRGGATYIATNPDHGLSTEHGITPGTGAIVAAVTAGCQVQPLMIGKPERRLFDTALDVLDADRNDTIAVGDNLNTDILAGQRAGMRTALILTGITKRGDLAASAIEPTWVVNDFEQLSRVVEQES